MVLFHSLILIFNEITLVFMSQKNYTISWKNRLGHYISMKSILYDNELAKWVELLISEGKKDLRITEFAF